MNIDAKRDLKGIKYDDATLLYFNPNDEVICSEYCVNRARIVTIYAERNEPKRGPSRMASNGKHVALGWAKCGVHNRGYSRTPEVNADRITKDPEANIEVALEAYEKRLAAEVERKERQRRDYMADLIRTATMTRDEFTIEEDRRDGGMVWVVYGPTGWSESPGVPQRRAVTQVALENDSGVYRVTTSDYSGSVGRGRGSTALTRLVADLMVAAADKADEMNAALGLDAPADAEEV